MGIIDSIKNNVAKSGTNKEKILFVKSDSKVRIRFLQEFDTGYEFTFHDSYTKGVNALCQEELGKNCPLCGDEELRTRTMYAWSVYNYDSKRVEVLLYAVNNCTPVAALMTMFETYGTILDRDYVLAKAGKSKDSSFTVIPQDKQRFRNDKAKPYTKSALLKIVSKAYPLPDDYESGDDGDFDDLEVEDYEDEPKPKKKKKDAQKPKQKARKVFNEDEEEDDSDFAMIDDDEVEESFTGKSKPKAKPKKKAEPEKPENISVEEMEEILDDEDIDIDEFLEYAEKASLKRIKVSEKKFRKMIKDYIGSLEDDEDEFDEEDDY